nr:uncharacterized protein LOC117273038 [Nicotiana tomentosiformis]
MDNAVGGSTIPLPYLKNWLDVTGKAGAVLANFQQRFVIGKSPGMVSPECFQISCLEIYKDESLEALLCKPPTDVIHRLKRRLLTHVIVMDSCMDPAMSSDDQQDVNAIQPGVVLRRSRIPKEPNKRWSDFVW